MTFRPLHCSGLKEKNKIEIHHQLPLWYICAPPRRPPPSTFKKKNLSSVNEVLPWFTWTKWYKVDKELDWPSCVGHMWWPVAFYPFIVCPTVVSPLTWQGVIIKNKVNWITLIMLISLKFKSLKVLFQIPSFLCGDELHVIWLILLNLRYAVKTEGKKHSVSYWIFTVSSPGPIGRVWTPSPPFGDPTQFPGDDSDPGFLQDRSAFPLCYWKNKWACRWETEAHTWANKALGATELQQSSLQFPD